MHDIVEWTPQHAAGMIARPEPHDDKYSRGLLGVMTGSVEYPGAAVLGVEAALRTGVGMVRYLGPGAAGTLVLQRRPEVVTAAGRVQAWLLGSGMGPDRDASVTQSLVECLEQEVPAAIDAGALGLVARAAGPVVVTPHGRELGRMLDADPEHIARDPALWVARAAEQLGVTVLLKGSRTHVATPGGTLIVCPTATPWLATAGTGDALGGVLGALLATNSRAIMGVEGEERQRMLAGVAATASVVHSLAAERASGGGPFTVLDLAAAIPATVAELLR